MSHGLSYGVRKTSATIMGLQLGLLLILLIAGAGVGSLLMASEWAFNDQDRGRRLSDYPGYQPVALRVARRWQRKRQCLRPVSKSVC